MSELNTREKEKLDRLHVAVRDIIKQHVDENGGSPADVILVLGEWLARSIAALPESIKPALHRLVLAQLAMAERLNKEEERNQ